MNARHSLVARTLHAVGSFLVRLAAVDNLPTAEAFADMRGSRDSARGERNLAFAQRDALAVQLDEIVSYVETRTPMTNHPLRAKLSAARRTLRAVRP